jgi:hypothetical protein
VRRFLALLSVVAQMRMRLPTVFLWVLVGSLAQAQVPKVPNIPTIKLTEQAGLARARFPVEVTVPFPKDTLKDAEAIRLFRVEDKKRVPVACQVMKVAPPASNGIVEVQLVFPANVAANGTATYEIAFEEPKGDSGQALRITGTGVGKTVAVGPAIFELDSACGQLLSFVPRQVSNDRLTFVSDHKERPIHYNPDVWAPPLQWTHTNKWNQSVQFDPVKHNAEAPPVGDATSHPFFYEEVQGPLAYRLTRWGKMPLLAQVDAGVTYTFFADTPFIALQSRVEIRADMKVNAVRNAELVFSRHQFDTAAWIAKDGTLHTLPCYDYTDKDKSFTDVVKLPPDVPCVGLVNERKGYGIAYIPLSMNNVNKLTGKPADQQAHFYVREFDWGKGNPNSFLYLVRPVVINGDYQPTQVDVGSVYEETSAIVVFFVNKEPAKKYGELVRWQKLLASPLHVTVE